MTRQDNVRITNVSQAWAEECGSDCSISFSNPRVDRFWVYVGWGAERSRPLYVGKARKPWSRFLFHLSHTEWAAEVVEWECHGFPTERQAETAEIEAIHDLNPIHNFQRRLTVAQWEEIRRESDLKEAAKAEARKKANEAYRARLAATEAKSRRPKVQVVSPHPRKRLRQVKWDDEIFTPDQLAIIRKVQNRGRAA